MQNCGILIEGSIFVLLQKCGPTSWKKFGGVLYGWLFWFTIKCGLLCIFGKEFWGKKIFFSQFLQVFKVLKYAFVWSIKNLVVFPEMQNFGI
jgi:hypothetical protein